MIKEFTAPPIVEDLGNELYHKGEGYKDYLSSTQLKDFLVSPKYFKYKQEHPEEFVLSDDALEFGSMYHSFMESMVKYGNDSEFSAEYHVFDAPINERTGKPYGRDTAKYVAALEEATKEYPDWKFVSQERIDLVRTMIGELLNNCGETSKQVNAIIKKGKAELSHFVEYNGCKFKFRPDLETDKKIYDWKTVSSESLREHHISGIITKFGYGISAAFYQFFEHEQSGVWKDFYWVFQQKTPPYDAVMVSAEMWAYHYDKRSDVVSMGPSAQLFQKLLDQYIECMKSGEFVGAEGFIRPGFRNHRIMIPEAPTYPIDIEFFNNK